MAAKDPSEWSLEDLHEHLMGAIELELLTIPAYLTALFSLMPGKNKPAAKVVHSVVMEEMLHLALASNVMNAVGGEPNLTGGGYVPRYPAALPFHKPRTFEVGLQPFSKVALEVFMAIEKPNKPGVEPPAASPGAAIPRVLELAEENEYETIGAFYRAVENGLNALGEGIFKPEPTRQIPAKFYDGAGGGHLVEVTNLESALEALDQIIEQGEGDTDKPGAGEEFDPEGELAHFYRFKELFVGLEYKPTDSPETPTGPPIAIDYTEVFPMRANLTASELSGELHNKAEAFNFTYSELLNTIQKAIDGEPAAMGGAIELMETLALEARALISQQIPGAADENAGPTFQFVVP
jgi:Ferritin-like